MTEAMNVIEMKKGSVAPEPVTEARVAEASRWLKLYKDTTKKSWAEIGKELASGKHQEGYSGSSLSVFISGSYSGNTSNIVTAIEQLRALYEERRATIKQPAFVATSISKRLFKAIRKTQLLKRMGIIAAESGVGKTIACRQYALLNPKCVYVVANPTVKQKVWPLITSMMSVLGIDGPGFRATGAAAFGGIVNTLSGTDRLLLIDEAQFISPEGFDLLRCLHEQADIPVVFSGNETLYERGARGINDNAAFVQFSSRTAVRERIATADITRDDVVLIAEEIVGVELARGAASRLLQQSQAAGGFRRLVTLLQIAQLASNGEPIGEEHIVKAITELGPLVGGAL